MKTLLKIAAFNTVAALPVTWVSTLTWRWLAALDLPLIGGYYRWLGSFSFTGAYLLTLLTSLLSLALAFYWLRRRSTAWQMVDLYRALG